MSLTDYRPITERIEKRLREALADLPGTLDVEVKEGRFVDLVDHASDDHVWAAQHGILINIEIREIPEHRYYVACRPWIRLDGDAAARLAEIDEGLDESIEAVRKTYANLTTPTPEENTP